jgi:hypothetical protein
MWLSIKDFMTNPFFSWKKVSIYVQGALEFSVFFYWFDLHVLCLMC